MKSLSKKILICKSNNSEKKINLSSEIKPYVHKNKIVLKKSKIPIPIIYKNISSYNSLNIIDSMTPEINYKSTENSTNSINLNKRKNPDTEFNSSCYWKKKLKKIIVNTSQNLNKSEAYYEKNKLENSSKNEKEISIIKENNSPRIVSDRLPLSTGNFSSKNIISKKIFLKEEPLISCKNQNESKIVQMKSNYKIKFNKKLINKNNDKNNVNRIYKNRYTFNKEINDLKDKTNNISDQKKVTVSKEEFTLIIKKLDSALQEKQKYKKELDFLRKEYESLKKQMKIRKENKENERDNNSDINKAKNNYLESLQILQLNKLNKKLLKVNENLKSELENLQNELDLSKRNINNNISENESKHIELEAIRANHKHIDLLRRRTNPLFKERSNFFINKLENNNAELLRRIEKLEKEFSLYTQKENPKNKNNSN